MRWVIFAALTMLAMPVRAQNVVDGDTLEYHGITVHLWGVDAPEKGQTCGDGWPAGKIAEDYLGGLIHGHKVNCTLKQTAASKPVFAICTADGQDLSAAMASSGMAWAYPAQTKDYTVAESNAMIAVLGIHGHQCLKAWEWRARQQIKP